MEFESASAGAPPYGIPVHPALTTVEPLPPGAAFPALAATEQPLVSRWITQDLAHLALAKERRAQKESQLAQIATGIRENQDWLGRPLLPLASTSILTESRRALVRGSGKSSKSRPQLKFTKAQLRTIANEKESLIPIRIDIEHATAILHDTFTWNLRETVLTPEIFAAHLCEDLRLPLNPFYRDVVEQIKRGIEEGNSASYDAHLGEGIEEARIANRNWFQDRAKRRKLPHEIAGAGDFVEMFHSPSSMPRDDSTTRVAHVEEGKNEDLRVLIRLDITLDTVQLVDKFEWDISNAINSPEEFAEIFSSDLGLSGEFKTAIAHAIREQIDIFTRSLLLLGHVSGLPVADDDLSREFLPPLSAPIRHDASEFTPVLVQLSAEELDRNDKEGDREVRRKRRQTKGRGVTLPDRDPMRTHRTLLPAPPVPRMAPIPDGYAPLTEVARPFPIVLPVLYGNPPIVIEIAPTVTPLPPHRLPGSHASSPGRTGLTPKKSKGKPTSSFVPKNGTRSLAGDWSCSHCGNAESSADSRQTGPNGPDSLCSACGEYFDQNHRLPRSNARPVAKSKARRNNYPSSRATAPATVHDADSESDESSSGSNSGGDNDDDSDNASSSSGSQTAVASRSMRGSTLRKRPQAQRSPTPDLPSVNLGSPDSTSSQEKPTPARSAPETVSAPVVRRPISPLPTPHSRPITHNLPLPGWMQQRAVELQGKFKNDRFEIIPRGTADPNSTVYEWRIRCLDCPGKLYNIGPGESLENFAVHVKNRNHRQLVEARLVQAGGPR